MELTSMFTKYLLTVNCTSWGKRSHHVPRAAVPDFQTTCSTAVENMDGIDLLYETGARKLLEDHNGQECTG